MSKITRSVFIPVSKKPFFKQINITFENHGTSTYKEKQECIKMLHSKISEKYPQYNALEISPYSDQYEGNQIAALRRYDEQMKKSIPVDNVYQASKKFLYGGPYTDLLFATHEEIAHDERLSNSGKVVSYIYKDEYFPAKPQNLFYDYLHMSSLLSNQRTFHMIERYNAYTDITFDPCTDTNCQAATVARLRGMLMADLYVALIVRAIEVTKKFPNFKKFKEENFIKINFE